MGFLDKAKAAADQLAAKADTALAGSGLGGPAAAPATDADRYFRDLGVLAYLEASGRPAPEGERERVLTALRDLEARGAVRGFALQTAAPPAPGAAAASVPPPPGGAPAPPAPAVGQPAPAAPSEPTGGAAPTAPPPPPPSWMGKEE